MRVSGVTLVELAVGLLILSLIIGGLLVPLASQVEQRRVGQTRQQLEEIREALLGFVLANGRLPCPASAVSSGVESPAGGGACSHPWNGFVPAVTLSLSQVDEIGFAIDAWGLAQGRVRYAVTTANSHAFTTAGRMRAIGMAGSVEAFLEALRAAAAREPWFAKPLENLANGSPTAARVTWEYMRRSRLLGLEQVLAMDLAVARQCQRHHDFPEGVRALLIDKSRDAVWSPARFEAVDQRLVDGFFAPLEGF
jgi:enoyl-CoA hydratase/carnithine racemase